MDKLTEDRMLVHALQYPQGNLWLDEAKRICKPSVNWLEVFKCADSVRLSPLLYRQLRSVKDDLEIPEEGLTVLKDAYLQNLAKNAYRGIELKRILQTFKNMDIGVILLKGASLSDVVYHDPGARIYGDLDILVHKEDMDRARDLLCGLGYRAEVTAEIQEHYQKKHHHLAPMIHPEKSVVVELHWNVNRRVHVDIDTWWKRSIPTKINGIPARILGWTDMMLHLCLHLFSSGETRNSLRGVVDIYRVLTHAGHCIDWTLFDEEVKRYGIQQEMYAILQTIQKIMDPQKKCVFWPDNMQANPSLVANMEAIVFSMRQPNAFPGTLVAFQSERKWRKKIALLWYRFFPYAAEMKARYDLADSSWKVYYYYLLRPILLFWRYGKFSRHLFGMK